MQEDSKNLGEGTGRFRAGTACVNITPPVGAWLSGYDARVNPSQGIHDELHGKALVLTDGVTRLCILSVDLIALDQGIVERIREQILNLTGIPPANVMLAASHTHAGPIIQRLEMFEEPDPHYLSELEKKLAGAVYVANENLHEARLGLGTGSVDFNINRRLPTPEGIVMRPNQRGPVDHTVGVVRIDGREGEPLAVLLHFSCHATAFGSSNLLISADYPGVAQSFVEQIYAPGCKALFLQGCSGDLRPNLVDSNGRFRGGSGWEVRSLGTILGAETVKMCEGINTKEATLAARSQIVELPFNTPPTIAVLKSLLDKLEKQATLTNDDKLDLMWARWLTPQLEAGTVSLGLKAEIQVFRIGDIILVALPGEVFTQIGQRIRAALGTPTLVIGCANGVIGYIPTADTHIQGGRNYETNVAFKAGPYPAPFSPQTEDLIVKVACSLAEQLQEESGS